MGQTLEEEDMVKYQFQAEDDEWTAWKNTVPRSKSLEQRINELIRADTEGRVLDEGAELKNALDDLEAAIEHGDEGQLHSALTRARKAVGNV